MSLMPLRGGLAPNDPEGSVLLIQRLVEIESGDTLRRIW